MRVGGPDRGHLLTSAEARGLASRGLAGTMIVAVGIVAQGRNGLRVRGLSAGYEAMPVLHDVDLTLDPGAITALAGANGAGKTTLLRAISGLLHPTAGQVSLDGRDLGRVSVERRARLGLLYVPEGGGVIAELTVEENLRLAGVDPPVAYDLVAELEPRSRHRGDQLSGGERVLLGLARAVASLPRVLLLDEPALGLAPAMVARLRTLLDDLRTRVGTAILLAEPAPLVAAGLADRTVTLTLGRLT